MMPRAGRARDSVPTIALHRGLRFLVSGARWALIAGFLVGGATFVALWYSPPTYQASALLLVPGPGSGNAALGLLVPPRIDPGAYRAAVVDGPIAADALTSLLGHAPTPEALQSFKKTIRVDVERQSISGVVRVRVSSPDPATARRAADALANGLLSWDYQRTRATVSRSSAGLLQTIDRINATLKAGSSLAGGERAALVALRAERARELSLARMSSASSVMVGLLKPLAMADLPERPTGPNVALGTLLATIAGIVLGYGLLYVLRFLDPHVRGRSQLEDLAGAPVLAEFPAYSRTPAPLWGEAASLLRSHVLFAAGTEGTFVLGVTAPRSGEEKARISIAVAARLVRAGYRTLLVDADLRQPHLTEVLGPAGAETAPFQIQLEHPRLDYSPAIATIAGDRTCDLVPGVRAHKHGAALLERALQTRLSLWRQRYDFIILDCPPALPYADMLAIARQCSGVVVCVPSKTSTPLEITQTTHLLRSHSANVLGMVLMGVGTETSARVRSRRPLPAVAPSRLKGATRRLEVEER